MSVLRYYQREAVEAATMGWMEHKRLLINTPTASGKTVIGSHIIKECLPGRSLWMADQDELCQQPLHQIAKHADIIPALHKGKRLASLRAHVIVASAQTLQREQHLSRYPRDFFRHLLVDEAHRGSDRNLKIMDYFKDATVVGFTATAMRTNMRDLSKYYPEVAFSMPLLNFIAEGFAPPMRVVTAPIEIDLNEVQRKRQVGGMDFEAESLGTTIEPYFTKIAEMLGDVAKGRKTIAFLPLIASSKAFAEICRRHGLRAIHVDGTSEDRDLIVEGFRQGRYDVLSNADLLGTGVDMPIADTFLNLTPGHSKVRYQQRRGRVMRCLPGVIDHLPEKEQADERKQAIAESAKPDTLIIDLLWQEDRLGLANASEGFVEDEIGGRMFAEALRKNHSPEELAEIAKAVQAAKEAKLVEEIEEKARANEPVHPVQFGSLIHHSKIIDYQPSSNNEAMPASEAQLARLEQWGFAREAITCKGLASLLMGQMMHRYQYRMISIKQMKRLHELGVEFNPHMTSSEARKLLTKSALAKMKREKEVAA